MGRLSDTPAKSCRAVVPAGYDGPVPPYPVRKLLSEAEAHKFEDSHPDFKLCLYCQAN